MKGIFTNFVHAPTYNMILIFQIPIHYNLYQKNTQKYTRKVLPIY